MATQIIIEGVVAQDPETRFTNSGIAVTSLRVLDNINRKVNGEWKRIATTAYDVTVWGYLAEQVTEGIGKGDIVTIQARDAFTQPWTSRKEPGKIGADIKCTADSVSKTLRAYAPKVKEEEPQPSEAPQQPAPRTRTKKANASRPA